MWDMHCNFYSEKKKHKRRCNFGKPWVEMRIIFKKILKKLDLKYELCACGSGWSLIRNSFEYGNEPSIFLEGVAFVEYMKDYQMFRNSSASQSSITKVIVNPVKFQSIPSPSKKYIVLSICCKVWCWLSRIHSNHVNRCEKGVLTSCLQLPAVLY
jgi:hypothetical protein